MEAPARRPYRLRARAERQAATRRRIVDAAVTLHGTVGPARTTISAIADLAGVERLTVYRHFPDQAALLEACWTRHSGDHPPPAMAAWFEVRDPVARLRRALTELYAWYAETESVTGHLFRDAPAMPSLRDRLKPVLEPLGILPAALSEGWPTLGRRGRARLSAVVGHALAFETWRSLCREGRLAEAEAAERLVQLAREAARAPD